MQNLRVTIFQVDQEYKMHFIKRFFINLKTVFFSFICKNHKH